jgi:hypothetical protein
MKAFDRIEIVYSDGSHCDTGTVVSVFHHWQGQRIILHFTHSGERRIFCVADVENGKIDVLNAVPSGRRHAEHSERLLEAARNAGKVTGADLGKMTPEERRKLLFGE